MEYLNTIVWSDNTELIPAADLMSELSLHQIEYDEDDYVLNKTQSRVRSKVVSCEVAELIRQFRNPTTLVDAVIGYSNQKGVDPEGLLEQVYPIIKNLIDHDFLRFEEMAAIKAAEWKIGELINGFQLVAGIQSIDDTDVFEATDHEKKRFIIKIAKATGGQDRIGLVFENELGILRQINGATGPVLIDSGVVRDHPYLVLGWIEHTPLIRYAERLRGTGSFPEMKQLLLRVINAYMVLHTREVFHVDINPRNILVGADGAIHLIDFGISIREGAPFDRKLIPSVDFFSPPELVGIQKDCGSNRWDGRSEQYAIAALLYFLYTGKHYLNFSFEKAAFRSQLLSRDPLTFEAQGIRKFPALEGLLRKALSKRPAERYSSLQEMAHVLKGIDFPDSDSPVRAGLLESLATSNRKRIIESLGDPRMLEEYFNTGPSCSLWYGGGGIAYFLYRLAVLGEGAPVLALADVWLSACMARISEENAFTSREMGLTKEVTGESCLFHSATGLYYVQALISSAMGDISTYAQSLQQLADQVAAPCHSNDLTLGRSSLLLALAELIKLYPEKVLTGREEFVRIGDELKARIRAELGDIEDGLLNYTGMAHGWAGILYAFLKWDLATGQEPSEFEHLKLRQLAGVFERKGKALVIRDKLHTGQYNYVPGWCNGSAGMVLLLLEASKLKGGAQYLEMAEGFAVDTVQNHVYSGFDICCGYTGRAWSLLSLFKRTANPSYLHAAKELYGRAIAGDNFVKADSFFKGRFGPALLALELEQPELAAFPFLEM